MKIKKNDKVIIIAGKDKGKAGTVVRALPKVDKVIVEGLNLAKKHIKAHGKEAGQIVSRAMPIHVSNVALADKAGKTSKKRARTAKRK